MKKFMVWLLTLALLFTSVGAFADGAVVEEIAKEIAEEIVEEEIVEEIVEEEIIEEEIVEEIVEEEIVEEIVEEEIIEEEIVEEVKEEKTPEEESGEIRKSAIYQGDDEYLSQHYSNPVAGWIDWILVPTPDCYPHVFGRYDKTVEATCTEDGAIWYICAGCGAAYSEAIPALGHKIGKDTTSTVKKTPTCSEKGVKTYHNCARCHGDWDVDLETLAHQYGDEEEIIPATCTEAELHVKTCLKCGFELKTESGKALGHTWKRGDKDEHVVITPTCTQKGATGNAVICDRCGAIDPDTIDSVEELDKLDHQKWFDENRSTFYTVNADGTVNVLQTGTSYPAIDWNNGVLASCEITYKPATCTEKGSYEVRCSNPACKAKPDDEKTCGFEIECPALGHDLKLEELPGVQLDCTKPNSLLYVCQRPGCGYEFNEDLEPAAAHTFNEFSPVVGYKQQKKSDSDYVFYPTLFGVALCHNYIKVIKCANPFCTVTKEVPIVASGRHSGEEKVHQEPSCTKPGFELHECDFCGYTYNIDIPALGHNLKIAETLKEPTCVEPGLRLMKCVREGCDYTEEQVIPALDHHFVSVVEVKADCKKDIVGRTVISCSICGEIKEIILDEGHVIPKDWRGEPIYETFQDAGCVDKEGSYSYYCKECHELIVERIEPYDHDWKQTGFEFATCKEGKEHGDITISTCTRCGKTDTVEGPVPGHRVIIEDGKVKNFVIVELPTCCTDGLAQYNCALCGDVYDYVLPAFGHNYEYVFNHETGAYETSCEPIRNDMFASIKVHELLTNAGYAEEIADCVTEKMMQAVHGTYIAGIGFCGYNEKIEVHKTEYAITLDETRGSIELMEDCMPIRGGVAYARITWRYTLSNGDTVCFTACRQVKADGTFKLTGLVPPSGSKLDFTYVEIVNDEDADEKGFGEYNTYGTLIR